MENVFNRWLVRFIVAAVFFVINPLTVSAQRYETHKVNFPDNGELTRTIKVEPSATFSVKKVKRCSWASYEVQQSAAKISVTANTSKKGRSCTFVLLDNAKTPVDTLEVTQSGKISTTVSKAVTHSKSATSSQKTSTRSMGGQCAAITKKGTRCSRNASAGSSYCWQHNK